jgi:hypothetical protein
MRIHVPPAVATALAVLFVVIMTLIFVYVVVASPRLRRRAAFILAGLGTYTLLASIAGAVRAKRYDQIGAQFSARLATIKSAAAQPSPADVPLSRACANKLEPCERRAVVGYLSDTPADGRSKGLFSNSWDDLPMYALAEPEKAQSFTLREPRQRSLAGYALWTLFRSPARWLDPSDFVRDDGLDVLLDARYVAVASVLPGTSNADVRLAVRVIDLSSGTDVCDGVASGRVLDDKECLQGRCWTRPPTKYDWRAAAAATALDGICRTVNEPKFCGATERYRHDVTADR